MNPEQEAAIAAAKARLAGKGSGFTPEQQAALDAARARVGGGQAKSPEMAAGLAELSGMTQDPPPPERSAWDAIVDNVVGRDDGVTSYGESLGTWLNRGGETMTLGLVGDEASAAVTGMLPGRSYDSEMERYRQNEADMSTMGRLSADLFGAVLPAFLPGGQAAAGNALGRTAAAVSKVAPTNIAANFIGRAPNALGAIGRGALAGGAMGGIQGFMDGEGGIENRLFDAALGGALGGGLGAAATGIGAGISNWMRGNALRGVIRDAAKVGPSTDELRATGNALYGQVDDAGVQIRPEAFDRLRADTLARLRANTGFDELPGPGSLTPGAARAMEIMDQAGSRMAAEPTAGLPFKSLDQMRRQAGAAAGNVMNKTDQSAGMEIIDALDDFIAKLGPDDVLTGDLEALKTAIPKAREVWGQMSRAQKLDDAIEAGGDYLSGGASGIRNQFKNLLRNPKRLRGFSEVEKAAMRSVVNGGPLEQLVTLAGGGMAQLGTIAAGGAVGGIPGVVVGGGLAAGQRKLSEAMTTAAAERVRAAIASGQLRGPEVKSLLDSAGRGIPNMLGAGAYGLAPTVTNALRSQ